jgi:predicted Zn-dependent protease
MLNVARSMKLLGSPVVFELAVHASRSALASREIAPTVTKLKTAATTVTNRDALSQRIDGLVFGDNPEQRHHRGSTSSPALRFPHFPSKGTLPTALRIIAKAPDTDVFMLGSWPAQAAVQEVAVSGMRVAGFRAVQGERATINGLDAFIGVYQGQIEGMGDVSSRAAHIAHGGAIYLIAGLVAPALFDRSDAAFVSSIRTFRPLTAAEAEAIHPNRIDFYVVRAGDTWASLAGRSAGAITATTLAVMNHAAPGSQPQPGSRIKIIVGG